MATTKDKVKAKVIAGNEVRYPSAQDFAKMKDDEKKALKEVIEEEGLDYDEYEKKARAMFPPEFHPKPLVWRTR